MGDHNIWFTSDLHFGHEKLVDPSKLRTDDGRAIRPFATVREMDDALTAGWCERVRPDDIVYVLGDVSFTSEKRTTEILARLPGYKVLVRGNHDEHWKDDRWKRIGFSEVYAQRRGLYTYGPKDFGIDALMIHNPGDDTMVGKFVLCGHVHDRWKSRLVLDADRSDDYSYKLRHFVNVGVDNWNFAPVSPDQILRTLKRLRGLPFGERRA